MTDLEIQEQVENYAISRGSDKDKKAFRSITNKDLHDHTVQTFIQGAKWMQEREYELFRNFIRQEHLSSKFDEFVKNYPSPPKTK